MKPPYTCQCGQTREDGDKYHFNLQKVHHDTNLDHLFQQKCALCTLRATQKEIKNRECLEKWIYCSGTGSLICPNCAHALDLYNHFEKHENKINP